MKKFALGIASLLACTALCCTGAAISLGGVSADEQTAVPAPQTQNGLIAPQTYQEYLPLVAPSGVAACEDYTAIADGNLIYIYNHKKQEYQTYTHNENGLPQDTVKKLQFCENGNLYFADNSPGENFYEVQISTLTKTKISGIACNTFIIHGTDLYFANASGTLYSFSLTDKTQPVPFEFERNPQEPTLAFWNNELYFTDNGIKQSLYKLNPKATSVVEVTKLDTRIQSMAITSGILAYTTSSGDFYAYTLSQINEEGLLTEISADNYTSVDCFGEYVYATQTEKGIVRQYSTAERDFTDFEICSASSAVNRLSGAEDICLWEDKLYIADNGNNRISVYDASTQTYGDPFITAFPVLSLTTDGETLLAVGKTQATLYGLEEDVYGANLQTFDTFNGELVGAASVYGKHYLVSEGYVYALQQAADGTWTQTDVRKNSVSFVSPQLFAADLHGDLYLSTENFVYRFTESTLLDPNQEGESILTTLPADTKKIVVDYEKNIYALKEGKIYKNGETQPLADFSSTHYVYGGENYTPQLQSFAFYAEENAAFLLFDGNYIVVSDAFALPTVKTISVENADESVFAQASVETINVVKTQPYTLLVQFDLAALNSADVFPYLSYHRETEEMTAIQLGETSRYNLLAVFDETQKTYLSYLALKTSCTPLPETEYAVHYAESQQKTAYLTNDVQLYKYPYLTDLLTVRRLTRNGEVKLIGEINGPHYAYYKVQYTENENVHTGYIPKVFVTLFDPTAPETQTLTHGKTQADTDGVWRFAYIALGFAAICILVDYLILRRPKDDKDDE